MPISAKEKEALRFLAIHLLYGLAAALTFGAAILVSDLSHIRTLAFESGHPVIVLLMMFTGLFVTFGGVSMAVGIMGLARHGDE